VSARANSSARGAARPATARPSVAPARTVEPLPLLHPAHLALLLVAAGCIGSIVSLRILDTDLWQHLAVGRAIWSTLHVPTTQVWSWPTYGAPDVNSSWGFEALLWPTWKWFGVLGLNAWRVKTALLTFGISWLVARRLGARGLSAVVVAVLGTLIVHRRTQLRPETWVGVLFALQVWVLETRRQGGRDLAWLLVPIAWAWANSHITYHLGFATIAIHLSDGWLAGPGRRDATRRLALVALAALAVSFVNPFGWRALAQPFEFLAGQRQSAIFANIGELQPIDWSRNLTTGLPLAMLGWPLLMMWRARQEGIDRVELAMCLLYSVLAISVQRFVAFYGFAMVPYLARDLDHFVRGFRWPRFTEPAWSRFALAATACGTCAAVVASDPNESVAFGLEPRLTPIAACDFMQAHDVRGHGFNHFFMGGYLLYRFWPEKDRLPFMDVHQSGGPAIQSQYMTALAGGAGWQALRDQHGIDWALLWRVQVPGDGSLDALDADTTFRLVFTDDVAALYVRRTGPLAGVADSFGYRTLVCGERSFAVLANGWRADSTLRRAAHAELARAAVASPWNEWATRWRDRSADATPRTAPFGR